MTSLEHEQLHGVRWDDEAHALVPLVKICGGCQAELEKAAHAPITIGPAPAERRLSHRSPYPWGHTAAIGGDCE